jgi:hypothetical protein
MSGLFTMRKTYQQVVDGDTAAARPPVWERIRRVWSRVTRAEFKSTDRVEMDMIDKAAPERTIQTTFERRGWEWKLTELRVAPTSADKLAVIRPLLAMQ